MKEKLIDYSIPALLLALTCYLTYILLELKVDPFFVTIGSVIPIAACALILERIRPENLDSQKLDQPLYIDILHYLINYNGGVMVGMYLAEFLGMYINTHFIGISLWPNTWNPILQFMLIMLMTEIFSYWQHRLFHTVPMLWKFHSLHHKGGRLNLIRAVRFHFIDIGIATFVAILPLRLLGGGGDIHLWFISIASYLGIIQHSNIQIRTPMWLNYFLCGPAVHRHHHSIEQSENDSNYGTYSMVFDLIFGTFQKPDPIRPKTYGIKPDEFPHDFTSQTLKPFQK